MITDAIDESAPTLFRKTYHKKRCIVQEHLKMKKTQASKRSETGIWLNKNLDTTSGPLRAKEDLVGPTDA